MLHDALDLCTDGPAAIRYPRGAARQVSVAETGSGFAARSVSAGDGSVCLVGVGRMLAVAEQAADLLSARNVAVTVWDPRVVRPFDPVMVSDAARHQLVVTIEDGIVEGGVGTHLATLIGAQNSGVRHPRILNLGIPTKFIRHGKPDELMSQLGLTPGDVARQVHDMLSEIVTL